MAKLRYVLDTNIVSLVVREPEGTLARRLAAMARAEFGISVIAACELRYGVSRKGSARLATQLEEVLEGIDILPLEEPADEHYGDIRAALERIGRPIGHNDLLIAAHARALGATLVTRNVDEFARVANLEVESWPDQH
jgi:tRNA(fMet)-specific endonuclease VapC